MIIPHRILLVAMMKYVRGSCNQSLQKIGSCRPEIEKLPLFEIKDLSLYFTLISSGKSLHFITTMHALLCESRRPDNE